MTPTIEILTQILWVAIAAGLIYRGYIANKKSSPASFNDPRDGLGSYGFAIGFVGGFILLILLANKILTCGVLCGTLLP